jgi:hypothetical protein
MKDSIRAVRMMKTKRRNGVESNRINGRKNKIENAIETIFSAFPQRTKKKQSHEGHRISSSNCNNSQLWSAMSALLRGSIPVASRTLVRLHHAKKSSSSSWVGAAKRPLICQRDISACMGFQARSLATSLQSQDDQEDRAGEKQWVASSFASHEESQLALSLPTSSDGGSLAIIHRTQFWDRRIPQGTNARYRQPPASIRSCLSFSQLVAADRATTDLAMRALMTWASSTLTTPNNHRIDWQKHTLAFVSTNSDSDDSGLRDPKLAKSGIRKTKIPTPPSGPKQQSMKPEDVIQEINTKSKTAITSGMRALLSFILNLPRNMFYYATHPSEVVAWWNNMKKVIKDEIDHYWVGTKVSETALHTNSRVESRLTGMYTSLSSLSVAAVGRSQDCA